MILFPISPWRVSRLGKRADCGLAEKRAPIVKTCIQQIVEQYLDLTAGGKIEDGHDIHVSQRIRKLSVPENM